MLCNRTPLWLILIHMVLCHQALPATIGDQPDANAIKQVYDGGNQDQYKRPAWVLITGSWEGESSSYDLYANWDRQDRRWRYLDVKPTSRSSNQQVLQAFFVQSRDSYIVLVRQGSSRPKWVVWTSQNWRQSKNGK